MAITVAQIRGVLNKRAVVFRSIGDSLGNIASGVIVPVPDNQYGVAYEDTSTKKQMYVTLDLSSASLMPPTDSKQVVVGIQVSNYDRKLLPR